MSRRKKKKPLKSIREVPSLKRKKSNAEEHPEAWKYFAKNSRLDTVGCYFIKDPSGETTILEASDPQLLFSKFIKKWYKPTPNSDNPLAVVKYNADNL